MLSAYTTLFLVKTHFPEFTETSGDSDWFFIITLKRERIIIEHRTSFAFYINDYRDFLLFIIILKFIEIIKVRIYDKTINLDTMYFIINATSSIFIIASIVILRILLDFAVILNCKVKFLLNWLLLQSWWLLYVCYWVEIA